MDDAPGNPQGQASSSNLTIDAPSTPDLRSNVDPPPSPASLVSCSPADAVAVMPPATQAAVAHAAVSPAWETKDSDQHQRLHEEEVHGPAAAGIAHSPAVALSIAAPSISALDPSTPVHAAAAGPRRYSATNLRPDLIPATGRAATAATAMPAPAPTDEPAAVPSPSGTVDAHTASDETAVAQGFFGSSTGTSSRSDATVVGAVGIPAAAAAARHEEVSLSRGVSDSTSSSTMRPPSSRSGMSGIFELELDSPLSPAAAAAAVGEVVLDSSSGDAEDLHGYPAASSNSSVAAAGGAGDSESMPAPLPVAPLPWGRIAPSPDSSPALRGPWGQLQEVRACLNFSMFNLVAQQEKADIIFFRGCGLFL